jgi:hypothetical protein
MSLATRASLAAAALILAVPDARAANRPPIAHAVEDQTVEGGATVRLDGSPSWDADGDSLSFSWVQTEGPAVALNLGDPVRPTFTAPTPGLAGVGAENQVLAFRLIVGDGAATSESEVRIMVLKPFDPVRDAPAVVTNGSHATYDTFPAGSLHAAFAYAVSNPGTRLTFAIPATDPSYNAAGGYWNLNLAYLEELRYNPGAEILYYADGHQRYLAHGLTIDGESQRRYAEANGIAIGHAGPVIRIGRISIGNQFDALPGPRKIVVRGLASGMYIDSGQDIVVSGNHFNVWPDGESAGSHQVLGDLYPFKTRDALHLRIGGATPRERNLFGPGYYEIAGGYRSPLTTIKFVGNYAGVNRAGTRALATGSATPIYFRSWNSGVLQLQVGGVTAESGNLFAGFGPDTDGLQIDLLKPGDRAVLKGNRIGTDATGTQAVPNRHGALLSQYGVGPEWIVGGPEPGAGNVFSGNRNGGVTVDQSAPPHLWRLKLQGNLFGTSADGLSAVPNERGFYSSRPIGAAEPGSVLLGGTGPGERNVFSGNLLDGIRMHGSLDGAATPSILGNLIGVAADGLLPLGNGGAGVRSEMGHHALPVGGVGPGEANTIAHNGRSGYEIAPSGWWSTRGSVRGNSIFDNGRLGISLQSGEPTPQQNDPNGDPLPPGWIANEGRDYPVIDSVASGAAGTTISGRLDTVPGLAVTLDFYANDAPDPSEHGEGKTFLGSTSFVAGTGDTPFSVTLPVTLEASQFVSATTTDADGNTSEFSANRAVTRTNGAPTADDSSLSTPEDVPVAISLGAADVDGDALTFSVLTPPAHGAISGLAPNLTYTPAGNFSGGDSFTFRVSDGQADSTPATVSVDVTPVNDAPLARPDTASSIEDTPVTIPVLVNDSDIEGDALSIVDTTPASHGTLSVADDGTITYAPERDWSGADSFTYTVSDGHGGLATVGVSVSVSPANDPPLLQQPTDQTHSEGQPAGLPLSASDPDGDSLTFSATGLPGGLAVDPTTGVISGTLSGTSGGSHLVEVTVHDGHGGSDSASFLWTVTEPVAENQPPTCDALASPAGVWPPNHKQRVFVDILGVSDPDGDPVSLRVTRILQDEPTNTLGDGETWIDGGGVGTSQAWVRAERTGTPRLPGNGRVYEIQFSASDGRGGSCSGVVFVGVPHDQGKGPAVDDGIRYDSTAPAGPRVR